MLYYAVSLFKKSSYNYFFMYFVDRFQKIMYICNCFISAVFRWTNDIYYKVMSFEV